MNHHICVLCVQVTFKRNSFDINAKQDCGSTIRAIIKQHFLFSERITEAKENNQQSIVCSSCWRKLENFHEFFCAVKYNYRESRCVQSSQHQVDVPANQIKNPELLSVNSQDPVHTKCETVEIESDEEDFLEQNDKCEDLLLEVRSIQKTLPKRHRGRPSGTLNLSNQAFSYFEVDWTTFPSYIVIKLDNQQALSHSDWTTFINEIVKQFQAISIHVQYSDLATIGKGIFRKYPEIMYLKDTDGDAPVTITHEKLIQTMRNRMNYLKYQSNQTKSTKRKKVERRVEHENPFTASEQSNNSILIEPIDIKYDFLSLTGFQADFSQMHNNNRFDRRSGRTLKGDQLKYSAESGEGSTSNNFESNARYSRNKNYSED